ncbi:MAG: serine/threonine protein kinase [Myxococcales bacterium]|nr:serine/threonine protein kinase [Myxococcales bacterium]
MVDTASLSRPFTPSPSPRPFGDYELLEHVGRGGMAEVWLARRAVVPGGLKPCALKIIHGRVATKPRFQRMFLQEARLALKLRHANLISVFDAGETDGRLFMALEWVDGVDLRCFAQRVQDRGGLLPVPVVCHIMSELLQGLRHAHELRVGGQPLGVIHRDIAPHNVLVSAAGEVKLADFGVARVAGELSSGMYVKGRARYMAPEQLRGETTQASDLFAVGAVLHELLEGRRFREDLPHRADWQHVITRAPLPPLTRSGVPPALEALRVGLLQADPRRRIASADAALGWLLRCPPWPPGAGALRAMYAGCVGAARRTGLTHADPATIPSRGGSMPSLEITGPTRVRPSARPSDTPTDPALPRGLGGISSACSPSWTPSSSASRATLPDRALAPADAVVRRRTLPPMQPGGPGQPGRPGRPGRPSRPGQPGQPSRSGRHRTLQRVGHGLWGLAALLGVTAAGLALAPGRVDPHACLHEPAVPPARRAHLRLRGDDRPLAQVRIDMQVLGVGSAAECWTSPGFHDLAWRSSPQEPWRPAGPYSLVSGKEHLFRVGEDGLAISAYDP